jgi:hypothetical protein
VNTNYVRGLCRPPHFHGVRQSRKEDSLVYRQFVVEEKFRPRTKDRAEETKFTDQVSPIQSCVGVCLYFKLLFYFFIYVGLAAKNQIIINICSQSWCHISNLYIRHSGETIEATLSTELP